MNPTPDTRERAHAATPPRTLRGLGGVAAALLLPLAMTSCAMASAGNPAAEAPAPAGTTATRDYTAADVAFMQGMLPHHRQALEMTSLVPTRTETQSIHLLAERIEVSQTDEIAQMSHWLESRGEMAAAGAAQGAHAHAHADGALMPGMLTEEELQQLAAARGGEFDRLFLEFMIRHHQGALSMVGQLLSSPGAAQDVDAYRIASEIDSDQRIEIERMERMLNGLG